MTPFREDPADILTETEAGTRTGSLSNVSYDVSLAVSDDTNADTFQSLSTVVFDAAVEGSETFINIAARSVDQSPNFFAPSSLALRRCIRSGRSEAWTKPKCSPSLSIRATSSMTELWPGSNSRWRRARSQVLRCGSFARDRTTPGEPNVPEESTLRRGRHDRLERSCNRRGDLLRSDPKECTRAMRYGQT